MIDISYSYDEEEDGFDGNIDGYIIDTKKPNLKNWFEGNFDYLEGISVDDFISCISSEMDNILILKNLNIDEEFQGEGYGSMIIDDIKRQFSNQFDGIILIADILESQKDNFILEKFYESNGFSTILKENDYPIMIYPEDISLKIKENIQIKKDEQKRKINKKFKI